MSGSKPRSGVQQHFYNPKDSTSKDTLSVVGHRRHQQPKFQWASTERQREREDEQKTAIRISWLHNALNRLDGRNSFLFSFFSCHSDQQKP